MSKVVARSFMLTTLVVSMLGVSFNAIPASSAVSPYPGGSCRKAGRAATYRQFELRCVRQRGSLTWRTVNSLATPIITLDNLDAFWTPIVARRSVMAALARNPVVASSAAYSVAPGVVTSQIAEEQRLLAKSERLFGNHFRPARYDVVLFSQHDGAWADAKMSELGAGLPYAVSQEIQRGMSGNTCNFGFATKGKNGHFFGQCMDTAGRVLRDKQTPIHEYFHLVQMHHMAAEPMPCWLMEGSATFFGAALGIDEDDESGDTSLIFLRELMSQYNPDGDKPRGSRSDLIAALASNENPLRVFKDLSAKPDGTQNCLPLASYAVGSLMTEALVASYGFAAFMEFITSFATKSSWQEDFRRVFGIEPESFFEKVRPYVLSKSQ